MTSNPGKRAASPPRARTPSARLPAAVNALLRRCPDPRSAGIALSRLISQDASLLDKLAARYDLAERLVEVLSASRSLTRLLLADPAALKILEDLAAPTPALQIGSVDDLLRWKNLELFRIAARDLGGWDQLEDVGKALATMADAVLDSACQLAGAGAGFAVISLGKLGANELNYSSDVDVCFVTSEVNSDSAPLAREVLRVASRAFRVDTTLRPEGRDGPIVRSIDSYISYWSKWARPWEIQALIKARACAGDRELGHELERAASEVLWSRRLDADGIAEIRSMKARHERQIRSRGLGLREIKRGTGGIRDIEFAVQLLQLIHGPNDPALRAPATLAVLQELASAGYVDPAEGSTLSLAYRFMRTLEHRLQLVEETQVHTVPANSMTRELLARSLGFEARGARSALEHFDRALARWQEVVRSIYERVFFRPLLEVFTAPNSGVPPSSAVPSQAHKQDALGTTLSKEAASERLRAFGFQEADRTRQALSELTQGLTRTSRLMHQLLPSLLGWMAESPDPDLALLGLRNLATWHHTRDVLISSFRDSPQAAQRLCIIAGTSRSLTELLRRQPELISDLGEDGTLAPRTLAKLEELARLRASRPANERVAGLRHFVRTETAHAAILDVLSAAGNDDSPTLADNQRNPAATARALSDLAEATLVASLEALDPLQISPVGHEGLAVIAMGRLGGRELSFGSDVDLLFVYEGHEPKADARANETSSALVRFLNGATPAERILTVDTSLRPEGHHGPLARSLDSYAAYFQRWSKTWEKQAYLRARPIAGNLPLANALVEIIDHFIWSSPFDANEIREIRRMKARVERERIPFGEDPEFHLKLGRGSLSDVEWTTQMLQLQHGVQATGTIEALVRLEETGAIDHEDARILEDSYRFCYKTRNRWHLVGNFFLEPAGASGMDSLPHHPAQLAHLARSLGTTTSGLREEYRRRTRRARRVMERLFYGLHEGMPNIP